MNCNTFLSPMTIRDLERNAPPVLITFWESVNHVAICDTYTYAPGALSNAYLLAVIKIYDRFRHRLRWRRLWLYMYRYRYISSYIRVSAFFGGLCRRSGNLNVRRNARSEWLWMGRPPKESNSRVWVTETRRFLGCIFGFGFVFVFDFVIRRLSGQLAFNN